MSARYGTSDLHQRDNARTQLFGSVENNDLGTPSSPYDSTKINYSQSRLAQLEAQSEENVEIMGEKIKALKNMSLKMVDEIKNSNKTVDDLGDTFENATMKLKNVFGNMMSMASKSRISLRTWLFIALVIFSLFFYVWLF